ncbi:MAG: TonB-dependent receptor [Opitutaceae bacterium]
MKTKSPPMPLRLLLLQLCALSVANPSWAQRAPTSTTPSEDARNLAQYDRNSNGVLDADETAAMQADRAKAAGAVSSAPGDGVIALNPFTVTSDKDSGYYAQNTLFGSRLNSNIGDLAASITVVTKQQLEDTGAVDINDVFLYEANTEGAGTYTPSLINRGTARDGIAGYSNDDGIPFGIATANRVRGLGAADTSQNGYPTLSRLIFDSYNTNSVEISRGPNSLLFGAGAASGVVNQSTSEAALNQRHTTVNFRAGSFGAWRASLSTNVPVGQKLAFFAAALYDEKGFQRKPSSETTRRQTIAMTYKPFSRTKLTASYEHYDNFNNRPNFAMPTDIVTPWRNAGRPSWDPTTQMVTIMATGEVKGPYLISTLDPRFVSAAVSPVGDGAINGTTSAFYIPGIRFPGRQRIRYDDGRIVDFWVDSALAGGGATALPLSLYAAPAAAARTAAQWLAASARYTTSELNPSPRPPASTGATQYGTWYEVSVTDKSIYDWEKYNIQGANYGTQNANTYNIELQQQILPNLNFQVGWFRQEMRERNHYGLGQVNDALRLFVDTNLKLLDGSPNPYYGSPYVQDWQADDFSRPQTNNNMRAMLAYELNLAKNQNWTRHLGKHRFVGLGSRQLDTLYNLRYRLSFNGGDPRFLPAAATTGAAFNWSGSSTIARYYYLGKGGSNGAVTQGIETPGAPRFGGAEQATLRFYNWNTQSFSNAEMNFANNAFYAGNANGVTAKKIDSKSFSWQGYFFNDRLLPTFGWRDDRLKIRQKGPQPVTAALYPYGSGTDEYAGILGNPFYVQGSTKTLGGVVKPFLGWKAIDDAAEKGKVWANLLRGSSFHYNESSNFNAPPSIQYDFFGTPLGKPQGHGKDYGFGISMFNNKLVARLNWYEATDENSPAAIASTVTGRTVRIDNSSGLDWARKVVRVRNGQNPSATDFDNNTNNPLTAQMAAEIQALWGLPFALDERWPAFGGPQGTSTNISKGKELQLTYNPTRSWTMKLTVGQQFATYEKALGELSAWIAFRKPQWEALVAPDLQTEYTLANGNKMYLGKYWTGYGFSGDAGSNTTGQTGSPSATYASIVEPGLFQLISQQGAKSPNLREWSSTFLSSYNFSQGKLKGLGVGGSLRWQDKAVAGYYGETNPARYAHPSPGQSAIVYPDLARPIYLPAETHIDLWVSYTRKAFADKVRVKVQLNVRDITESGGLQAILFNADGSPAQYRIKDPRTYFVSTTFDF